MIKKTVFHAILVLALPLAAIAGSNLAGGVVKTVTAMPEPSTLGLLGTGLVGFAVFIRRYWAIGSAGR